MTVPSGTVPAVFAEALVRWTGQPALEDREGTVSYDAVLAGAAAVAEGLARAGVKPGESVGLYADNSRSWIVADLALHVGGFVSVPRGTDTPAEEMVEFFRHAGVRTVLAHGARAAAALEAQRSRHPGLGEIVCIDPAGAPGRTLDDLVREGAGGPSFVERAPRVAPGDAATIIYTSGTTGRPKGVVLAQSNFGHQLRVLPEALGIAGAGAGEHVFLSILPPWHIFERIVEYVALTQGARLVYTDARRLRDDLAAVHPTFVPSVPRIWESVHARVVKALEEGGALRRGLFRAGYGVAAAHAWAWDRVRGHVIRWQKPQGAGHLVEAGVRLGALAVAALTFLPSALAHKVVFGRLQRLVGGRLRGAVSGGGLLPAHIDRFFHVVGLPVLIGYGLTETSPVLTVRRRWRNVIGTIGSAVAEVELQIRDPESGAVLPPGSTGVIHTRGPQVMRGYHLDPEQTRRVLSADGWFDTGDLGALTPYGDLVFRGRQKETIVLSGGENVEPGRVEEAILASPLVEQALVVGQDRKILAALVLPRPEALARVLHWPAVPTVAEVAARRDALERITSEVLHRTAALMPFERVTRVALLPEALDPQNGCLTATLKPRRHVIVERYRSRIEEAYAR